MIRKTQKYTKRMVKHKLYGKCGETVLIDTYWFLWVIPIYQTETIISSSI